MSKRGDPWFKFYPHDWLAGTRGLSLEQRGAYIDTICMQMECDGPLTGDYRWLSFRMFISERKAKSIVESLIEAKKLLRDDRGLYNARAEIEIADKAAKRRANVDSALARWRPNSEPETTQQHKADEPAEKTEQKQLNEGCERIAKAMPRARALDTDTEVESKKDRYHLVLPLSEPDVSDVGKAPKKPVGYSADFEQFWTAYPDRTNNSKIKAFGEWGKLARDERRLAIASLSNFAAYCKGHPDYRCVHAERYLRDKRFEGYAASETATGAHWWQDSEKVACVTDDQWRNSIKKSANGTWPIDKLSPPPGTPGCRVPANIVAELRLVEIYGADGVKRSGGH